MKQYPIIDTADMLAEGIVDTFAWQTIDKEEAEKLRKNLNMALGRREISSQFLISVVAAVKNDLKTVTHFVFVEKKDV